MTVPDFTRQVDWLDANFDIVSLEECQKRIRSGYNDRPTVAITFDDGYSENGEFAIPYLLEKRLPLTYFVTTEHTIGQKPFGHDLERGEPLAPDSIDSLRAYAAAGVEIGGHTRTHPNLGGMHDPRELVDEVLFATREMSDAIGTPIRYFAFPFGQRVNLNPVVFQLLKEHGFAGVCSAYGGWNSIGDDAFHLQRVHGDPNFSRLRNQLTFDPRLASIGGYDYSTNQADQPTLELLAESLRLANENPVKSKTMPAVVLPSAGTSSASTIAET